MAARVRPAFPIPPPQYGYLHKGHINYALQYSLEPLPETPGVSSIIAWLDRAGNNAADFEGAAQPYIAPAEPGKPIPPPRKLITMKPGEELLIQGQPRKILKVEVFSQSRELTPSELTWWNSH
jgi:hypothetical protein